MARDRSGQSQVTASERGHWSKSIPETTDCSFKNGHQLLAQRADLLQRGLYTKNGSITNVAAPLDTTPERTERTHSFGYWLRRRHKALDRRYCRK